MRSTMTKTLLILAAVALCSSVLSTTIWAANPRLVARTPPAYWAENEVPYPPAPTIQTYWNGTALVEEECSGCLAVVSHRFVYPLGAPAEQQRVLLTPARMWFLPALFDPTSADAEFQAIGQYVADQIFADTEIDVRLGLDTDFDGVIDQLFPGPFEQPIAVFPVSFGRVKSDF